MNLTQRLLGEIEWTQRCITALVEEKPSAIVGSCIPLAAAIRIQSWSSRNKVPFIYWLQDLQGRAISTILEKKLGPAGAILGRLASNCERRMLARSSGIITIAPGHENELPKSVRQHRRYELLENWANVEDIPAFDKRNSWSLRHGLQETQNIVYAGTLGLKHDLKMFIQVAESFRSDPDVRVVVVSSGQAADHLRSVALEHYLWNLVVLPFQPSEDVPQVLGSASVLIAPLDPSAGSFCVPSKVLSYLCAGRPIVIAIDRENAAATMIRAAGAGSVALPGDAKAFISAIRELLEDEPRRQREGAAARAFALKTFALDRVVPRFLDILSRANVNLTRQDVPDSKKLLAKAAVSQD